MDPFSRFNDQMQQYEYTQQQRENCTDLTPNGNDSLRLFAKILFDKSENNLNIDLSGLIFDDSMNIIDVFCMLVELTLYGFDILSNGKSILELEEAYDDIIFTIKSYLKSTGFDMDLREIFMEEPELYRDTQEYFCEILTAPPYYMRFPGWYVLSYRLIENNKFSELTDTRLSLEILQVFFISKQNKLFTISFKFK